MIYWINGAFGSGKTTLSNELSKRIDDSMTFDPEHVGLMLKNTVPPNPSKDFQDLPIWRRLVAQFILELRREYNKTLIISMTLVNADYSKEIFDAIKQAGEKFDHIFLDVNPETLKQRITDQILDPDNQQRDEETRQWRLAQIDRCVAARNNLPQGTIILNATDCSPSELADLVLD